ncbi:MAG TPA: hypothetical protein VGX23_21295 [Actinocrinis sp.]|nr:hypothetical protein [Actinocrinis sp.]
MDSPDSTDSQIFWRAAQRSMTAGILTGIACGCALPAVSADRNHSDRFALLVFGVVIGVVGGLLFGMLCGVLTAVVLAGGARYFTAHLWVARLFAAVLNGALLAALALRLTNYEEGHGLILLASAFAAGALIGATNVRYVVTGHSWRILRRMFMI